MIRSCQPADAAAVADIYNDFVTNTVVTFEEAPVAVAEMARRIEELGRHWPWIVFEEHGVITGYAYATDWKARSAYRFSVETTVYVAANHQRRGVGARLYGALLARVKEAGAHTVVGGIALPNAGSVALHEKLGFEKVGQFREIGFKLGRWVDVGYWQLVL
jgi:L-amino acid N-acyltransferase YncA